MNHTVTAKLQWRTPLERTTVTTPDISPLLRFYWCQKVYYKIDDSDFPSDTRGKQGHFVGIVEHVGHAMTFKILIDDTHKIIYGSNIRNTEDLNTPNLSLDLFDGEELVTQFIISESDNN